MLQTIDPSVPTYSPQQRLLAYLVVAFVVLGAAVVLYRLRYVGLDDDRKSVVAAVETALARQTPGSVRITGDPRDRRGDIRAAFASAGRVEETTTTAEALGSVFDAALETYRPLAERLPRLARRLIGLALLILVFGALAVSSDSIIGLLQSENSLDAMRYWPGAALRDTIWLFDAVAGLPVIGTLGTLIFAYSLLLFEWAYRHYWFIAAVLVIVAVRLATLRDDIEAWSVETALPSPRRVGLGVAGVTVGAWTAVLLAAGVGRWLGPKALGRQWALGVAVLLLAAGVVAWLWAVRQLIGGLRQDWRVADGPERLLVVGQLLGIVVAGLGAPLLPAWVALGLLNLPRIVTAWLAASLGLQLVTILLLAVILAAVAVAVRQAAADVRAALSETLARNSVRVALGTRALPLMSMVFVYLVAVGFGAGAPAAVAAAVAAGLALRGLWALAQRVRYRARMRPETDPGAERVIVHAYEIDTPAGTQWVARVNGEAIAHPDRETAVDAVVAAARDWLADGQQHPSLASAHADLLREEGIADIDATRDQLRAQVRRTAEGRVRKEGMLDRDELEDDLAERYPSEVWRPTLRRLRQRGPLAERDGYLFAD